MYNYNIYNNCNHVQHRPLKVKNSYIIKLDKSTYCCDILIDYIDGMTLKDFILNNKLQKKYIFPFLLQLIKIVIILAKGGYSHNDLHPGNIMIIDTNEDTFLFKKNIIPYHEKQLICIDYGNAKHKKFKLSNKSLFFTDFNAYINTEIILCILIIITNYNKKKDDCIKQKKLTPKERIPNPYLQIRYNIFNNHIDFWNKTKNKYSKIFKNNNINLLEKNYLLKNTIIPIQKINNDTKRILLGIETEFDLDFPIESAKYLKWCSVVEPLLPIIKIKQLLVTKTQEDIVNWCLDDIDM